MKLITPLDYWRAGFELWLAAWQAQLQLNDRLLVALAPARAPLLAPHADRAATKPARRKAA